MYLLVINQALPYRCSFVTYGHPEGSDISFEMMYPNISFFAIAITDLITWSAFFPRI